LTVAWPLKNLSRRQQWHKGGITVAAEGKIAIGMSNVRAENLNHVQDSEPAIPIYDYLKISPTDLHKFGRDDQVTLLANKPPPATPTAKGTEKGTEKAKELGCNERLSCFRARRNGLQEAGRDRQLPG
jgi:hypothetical protein